MPQDIDALLNDYHSQRGTKRGETPDSGSPATSDSGGEAKASEGPSEGFLGTTGSFLKGAAKGLGGDIVGAGQLARGASKLVGLGGVTEAISESAPAQWFANEVMAPSQSTAESIGNWAGGALPYVLGGPESVLARGIISGAIQPTKEGTFTSHIPGAIAGGILGLPGTPGGSKALHALSSMARWAGIPVPHMASVIKVLNMMQNSKALGQTAVSPAVKRGIAGAAGAGAGQAFGNQGSVYEEDYQPRYRPSSQ